jgi:hypothetical protein
MSKVHDLAWLFNRVTADIASEYQRIQSRVKEDPGTAGDQGEENWAAILRKYLPANYHIRTKGRIVAADGNASRQVDILVLSPSYPEGLLDSKMYVAAGVLAVFECKITLRRQHITSAVKTAAEINRLTRSDQNIKRRIAYGLLAHSHALATIKRAPGRSLYNALITADQTYVDDPRECLDLLCIADLGTWTSFRRVRPGTGDYIVENSYMQTWRQPVAPVGAFLTTFLAKLGVHDSDLGSIASYFRRAAPAGVEVAFGSRHWHFAEIPLDL